MAKDEYAPFTGKLDAAPQFEPFDGTLDGEKPKDASALRKVGDLGLSVAKGVVAVPEALVGLADIPTGGRVGKFLENEGGSFGFRPKQAKEYLGGLQSDDLRDKQQQFQKADGIIDKAGVALSNPSLIANAVAESVPLMGAGAVPARAALAVAPKLGAVAAGAIGEGVVGAGSAAEGIRQETADGLLTPGQSGLALASGAATAGFGFAGGKLAQRLGIGDVDTMLTQGAIKTAGAPSAKSIPRQVVEGAIAEGWLEELPQSVSEQVLHNLALDKPWHEGVSDAAVMGTLAGMAMGGGAAGVSGFAQDAPPADVQQPPAAPPAPPQPQAGPALALPAPDPGVIAVGGDGTARTPAYQKPSFAGEYADVTDVVPRALAPQPADPVRAAVESAANSGGALSGAALVAIDSGVTPRQEGAFEDVPELGVQPQQVNLDDLADPYDRAYYESLFDDDPAPLGAPPVLSAFLQNDDDIPDFDAANNVSEEDFLRALGADEQEIQDAIATTPDRAESAPEGAALPAGPQANVTAGTPEGTGAGAEQPAGPVADAPTNLRDALAKIRAQKQEAANAQAAQAPAPAATPATGPAATAVEAAGVAPQASIQAITAKQIPDMTDAELQQAIAHYGPDHKRTAKLQAALDKRQGSVGSVRSHSVGSQSIGLERADNSAAADAERVANFSGAKAGSKQLLNRLDADDLASMERHVLRVAQHPEIFNAVVKLIPVNVMNMLRRQQLTPEILFGNPTMLTNGLVGGNSDHPVTIPVDAATAVIRAVASVTAKDLALFDGGNSRRLSVDAGATSSARKVGASPGGIVDAGASDSAVPGAALSAAKDVGSPVDQRRVPDNGGSASGTSNSNFSSHVSDLNIAQAKKQQKLPAGDNLGTTSYQTQQAAAQPAQAGPAQPAQGLTDAAPAENHGAQGTPAPGAQAQAPGNANWAALTPEQRRRARLEHEIATGQTNNGGVVASLRPSAIEKRKQELAAMGDAGKLPSPEPAETREQRAQRVAQAGDAWTRMPTVEREALAARADGLNPIQRKRVPSAAWASLNASIQRGLADAMGGRAEYGQNQAPAFDGKAQEAIETVAPSSPPVRIGRDQTPLNEGGKPFKTRKAAGEAKKLQPMMRVVTVEGGYALAEKTPAQLAAEAKAARRLAQPRTGTAGAPLAAHEFIAAEGGLNAIAASDLGIDGNPRIGNRRLFAGRGRGLSMEQATQKLIQDGYLGEGATLNDAYALIKKSLSQPQYNADGIERIGQAEAAAQFEDYLAAQEEAADDGDPWGDAQPAALEDFTGDMLESSGYDAAADAIKAEVRALLEMSNALGIDAESITLDAHEQTINATEQDYYAAAKSALEAAIARSNGDRRTPAGSESQGQSGAATGPAAQELNQPETLATQAQEATENVAPESLELASQTPAEAAALQESQEQAAKEEAAAKRAADAAAAKDEDRKRIAQASVRAADSFELGQDPMDSLTGQGGLMFSRTGAQSSNAQQLTSRAWYDRFVSLLPASYRNDPHRREPLPAEDWNVQRASEVRSKVEALNKQLRGADDRKGYGPVSVDGLGNLQVDARDVSAADLTGGIMALANELGAGIAATNVRSADARALQNSGFVPESSLAAIADRLMQRPFASPTNNYAKDSAPGTVMTYKPRGFPAALFARDVAQNNATPAISRPDSNARNVATQMLVDGLKAKWTRAPEIIVARNMQDTQIPQAVRDYDETLKSQGATGEARGFIYKGKVYLLSDELKGPQQIAEVLFHEVLGHYGLRGAFGDSLDTILQQIGTMRRRDVAAKAREYGLFDKDALGGLDKDAASDAQIWAAMSAKDRLSAAEEVLAELAQSRPEIGFVKRAVAAIRNWLRSNIPGFKSLRLTDADIIQKYLLPARRYVTRSKETGAQSLERAMMAFSRTSTATGTQSAWDAPVQTGFDDVIYKLQDKNIDLKRVVEAITKSAGQVADSVNAYLKEELFHKRAAKRVADFGARELKPLMNQMRLAGLSMEDVEEYLHARHAKEANDVIAQRNPGNPGLQDGGSGMTNQAADNYFANLDPGQRRKLEAVAAKVDAIIADTRKLYVSYGLEDQAVVDGWVNLYQHYIPLQREDKEGGMGTGQGFSVKGKETKGRTGSTRKVVDVLANIASQRERLIVRGEKNRVTQALVGLAQANPNAEFWEVRSQAPTERVFDPKTGVVVDRPDPLFKSRDNVIVAKVQDAKGSVTEQMVVFNEDNPRAVRMAAAMKNLDAGNLEGLLGMSAKITRYFSAINTQYNPVFGVVNLVRDVQGAMVNLAATPLAGQQGKIAKDTMSALAGIYSDIRKTRKGGQATSKWAQLWEQMQDDGGTTGYRELFTTSADRANNLKSILNPEGWMDNKWGKFFTAGGRLKVPMSVAQKGASEIFGWLSDYNEAMENGVRLAAYKAALDKGMSREQAASLAKNLTVNFNRKGQVGQQAGAVYAFFNAAMQGTARIGQTLFDMDGGDVSTLRLSKTGKAVVYGGVTLGAIQALALAGAGFDDEDPPEFVRERSLIIPTGGKTYVAIPMPLGLHVIPGIGRHATEFALSGFDKPAKRAVSMVGMFADAFNPIGNAGLSMQTIAPTALDPLAALTENKDWTGKPIARVSSNRALPGHTQWKDTATGFSKVVAEAINWVSGGNEYVAGALSPTPDQIDYLLAQVGGGVAREAAKVQQTITTALSGEALPTHKVPLLGRFVGNAASQASQGSAFYANLNKLNELETEIKGLRKDGRFDEAAKLVRENPQATMIAMANRAERDVQKLRRDKRELIAKDASREEVRAKEEQITAVMMRLNEAAERRKAN